MPEQIEIGKSDFNNDIQYNAIITAITSHLEKIGDPGGMLDVFNITTPADSITVCLTINGVEVSLKSVLEAWQKHIDEHVELAAARVINGRLDKFDELFCSMSNALKEEAVKAFPDIDGIDLGR